MTESSIYQQLRGHPAYLRLTAAAEALAPELDHAGNEKLRYSAFLTRLLGVEVATTEKRRLAGRRRIACLAAPWHLENFDLEAQPKLDRKLIDELATLRFVEKAGNALFIGPPRAGQTMLAVGLGRRGVEAGYRVYYTTAADHQRAVTELLGLAEVGAARVSVDPAIAQSTHGVAAMASRELLGDGTYTAINEVFDYGSLNKLVEWGVSHGQGQDTVRLMGRRRCRYTFGGTTVSFRGPFPV